jgi:hypothetical protein
VAWIGAAVGLGLATVAAPAANSQWIAFAVAAGAMLLILAGLAVVSLSRRSKGTGGAPPHQRSDDEP